MGVIHRATLAPSKQELVASWLPTRLWTAGRRVDCKLAEYRFDDPVGEVGVETILWRTDDGAVVQTPLTYRAAPLAEAEPHLIGISAHSVLGQRWVYDGCGDQVWAATLAEAIATGGIQAQMFFEQDGERIDVPPRMRVEGSGSPGDRPAVTSVDSVIDDGTVTVIRAGDIELTLARVVGSQLDGTLTLTGRIGDSDDLLLLATMRRL
jgi:Maltokinase N-terminal cap domain